METQAKRNVVREYCNNTICEDCKIKQGYRCIDIYSDADFEMEIAFDLIQEEE